MGKTYVLKKMKKKLVTCDFFLLSLHIGKI